MKKSTILKVMLFGGILLNYTNVFAYNILNAIDDNDIEKVENFIIKNNLRNDVTTINQKFDLEQERTLYHYHSFTPLCYAVARGKKDIVKLFLKNGADPNKKSGYLLPLGIAIENGDLDMVKLLLNNGADYNNKQSDKKLLHIAMGKGHESIAKELIEEWGAGVNDVTKDGQTPLHFAARIGKIDLVRYLIAQQANIYKNCQNGYSALDAALEAGHFEIVKLLHKKGVPIDPNKKYKDGETAFHKLAEVGRVEFIKDIVEKTDADVNSKNKKKETPIFSAIRGNNLATLKYFVEKKTANVNIRDKYNNSILHVAAYYGNKNAIDYFVDERKMDIEVANQCFETPLHIGVRFQTPEFVDYLIKEKRADINKKAIGNESLLHIAAKRGDLAMVKYLVEEQKMNIHEEASCKRTPVVCAACGGNLQVVKYFIKNGAKIKKKMFYQKEMVWGKKVTKCIYNLSPKIQWYIKMQIYKNKLKKAVACSLVLYLAYKYKQNVSNSGTGYSNYNKDLINKLLNGNITRSYYTRCMPNNTIVDPEKIKKLLESDYFDKFKFDLNNFKSNLGSQEEAFVMFESQLKNNNLNNTVFGDYAIVNGLQNTIKTGVIGKLIRKVLTKQ